MQFLLRKLGSYILGCRGAIFWAKFGVPKPWRVVAQAARRPKARALPAVPLQQLGVLEFRAQRALGHFGCKEAGWPPALIAEAPSLLSREDALQSLQQAFETLKTLPQGTWARLLFLATLRMQVNHALHMWQ